MKTIRYSIAAAIFEKVPGYIRGLVVVRGANNAAPNADVQTALRNAEKLLVSEDTVESLLADPRITTWRDAFKSFGMNPSEFRPAHEALSRRAVQAKPLPFINTLVDVGNALSLRHRLPVGVHPLNGVKSGMELRLARGDESFVAFGSDRHEQPRSGEVVFSEENTVISRCWVWRQAKCSVTLPTTSAVVMNIDGLPPIKAGKILEVCAEAEDMIRRVCGGEIEIYILSAANPALVITAP